MKPTALIFVPDHLVDGRVAYLRNGQLHPWGYALEPTIDSSRVIIVFSFVSSCDSRRVDQIDVASQVARENGLDANRIVGKIHCLLSDCPNVGSDSKRNEESVTRPILLSSLWIAFRYDLLTRLRRSNFAATLDQYTANRDNSSFESEEHSLNWNLLVEREQRMLTDCFGPCLTMLILDLTEFPVDPDEFRFGPEPKNKPFTERDGFTHRLRGLLPSSLTPGDELFSIPRALLTETVHRAYKIRPTTSSASSTGQVLSPTYTNDTSLTLLGTIQVLFLLLSLLTPLHTARSADSDSVHLVECNRLSSPPGSSEKSQWPDWIVSEIDCTRMPTLGWFFLNTSEPGEFVMPSDRPPILSFFTCELTRLLVWLESGEPAGLKINLHLARLMGHFFLYHILAWRTYCGLLIYMAGFGVSLVQYITEVHSVDTVFYANLATSACLMLGTLFVASTHPNPNRCISSGVIILSYVSTVIRLTVALILCLFMDLINLLALHLTTFYVYTVHLLMLQCRAIGTAWRLCRNGSKWNPLRNRVDTVPDMYVGPKIFAITRTRPGNKPIQSRVTVPDTGEHDVHLDRLFVATLLGLAVSLCLLPTTLAFYATFGLIRLVIVLVQNALRMVAVFILDMPVSALLAWLFHSDLSRSE
ncbi:unnamed protein product [Echinostoma caproni]|uniref:Pecanex-like protein n=1 Tax=Echinostoma caproni TaxID=27848 RepID=A0A183ALL4_9TREM|nr:unnamed protein product [Echinostoma caproni]